MNDDYQAQRQFRATMLAIMFVIFLGSLLFLFLMAITGGAILIVPLGIMAVGALGAFHYFLWGRTLSHETEGEREEEKEKEATSADEWDIPMFKHSRRF